MKKFLEDLLKRSKEKRSKLAEAIIECDNKEERQNIQKTIDELDKEITDTEIKLDEVKNSEVKEAKKENEEARSGFDPSKALNVVQTAKLNNQVDTSGNDDSRASLEYRKAFMNYVIKGEVDKNILQFKARDNQVGTSNNLGVLIPTTVIQKIIKDVSHIYGQLYSRVKKTNLKGGVKYPIGAFGATFNRITETGAVSERQNVNGITGYVEFSYNIGEIRLARTLLQVVLSVDAFEQEFAQVVAKTYVKAMDKEIITGDPANNQMTGILTEAKKSTDSRIAADNIIEFTEAEMFDWTSWQTKLFAKIPLSMRSLRPEFVMTAHTYEANIKTLKDDNNRPLYNETYNPVDGSETSTFKGRQVVFVEEDILSNFDDAGDGDYFGMYWVPDEAYAINTNYEFTVVDYFDHETNQYIKKALVINDGKVLDPKYIYLLKKKVTA